MRHGVYPAEAAPMEPVSGVARLATLVLGGGLVVMAMQLLITGELPASAQIAAPQTGVRLFGVGLALGALMALAGRPRVVATGVFLLLFWVIAWDWAARALWSAGKEWYGVPLLVGAILLCAYLMGRRAASGNRLKPSSLLLLAAGYLAAGVLLFWRAHHP